MPFDGDDRDGWAQRLALVRRASLDLAAPLSAEDCGGQAMPDASPTKWHLAHTTWFFSRFVLEPAGRAPKRPESWNVLFNSYYEAEGPRHPRALRGLITRPSLSEVLDWRADVDDALAGFVREGGAATFRAARPMIELGMAHEEQHQELMLTDILALFAQHAERPAYRADLVSLAEEKAVPLGWRDHPGGLVEIGAGPMGFAFDCERPRAKVWLQPYRLADRLISNGEWRRFMADDGYRRPELWLSDGWAEVKAEGRQAPLYWRETADGWVQMTLAGEQPILDAAPVSHVSFWEADAYARWAGHRLPTEAEWEHAAADEAPAGGFRNTDRLRPIQPRDGGLFGECWQWTQTAFAPHPGFRPLPGAAGEYNGKFMAGQFVLKGGSCLTPDGHVRASYRNFFYPGQRWQMTGVRLARDAA